MKKVGEFFEIEAECGEVDDALYRALLNHIRPPGFKIEIYQTPCPSGMDWSKYKDILGTNVPKAGVSDGETDELAVPRD